MLFYETSMQIYHPTSIHRNLSKLKLCYAVSLGLGIKGVKIARNVVKVGVNTRLSNGHQNLWSNLNFNKLVKSETRCLVSLGFGIKEAKITPNMANVGVHSCLPNGHLNLWLNFNSKKLVKSEISSCGFAKVGLKGVENSLEHHKKLACMLFYEMGIQINDHISIPRNCSKVKLRHVVSLVLGLKG